MIAKDSGQLGNFISELRKDGELSRQIAHHRQLSASAACKGECKIPWPNAIKKILEENGLDLYSHQARAMDYIRAGKSVIISTHTASGKSLIYNLPFLENFLRDQEARALYLFPLKALAQDQLANFKKLSLSWPESARPSAALYDGDTPDFQRRQIRKDPPSVIMTNPEMLHLSFLAYHESWVNFLANLSFIVIDEAHCYRGIFGSHMAQIFQRLNRVCRNYGADPLYIFCSATLGNPRDLAKNLSGKEEIQLIDESGAPRGKKHFIFMDPEQSSSTCAIELLKRALKQDLRTIVYCQSRKMTELISMWAMSDAEEFKDQISAYRAGFLPEERREIEAKMSSGELKAVISTSALELGIDIGGLDLCILAGYPGTIMQTLQRGGRVGRAGQDAAIVVIAGDDALDQYFIRNPQDFFIRPPEKAVINPYNPFILEKHLECAAIEKPLNVNEEWVSKEDVQKAIDKLSKRNVLIKSQDGQEWLATSKRMHNRIDLRGCGNSYVIEDQNGKATGVIDGFRAWKECHPGAIYIHRGRKYIIDSIDDGRMRIVASQASVDWHTRIRTNKQTEILEVLEEKELGRCAILRCKLKITEKISSYEKRSNFGNRLLGVVTLKAPDYVFETEGICLIIPDSVRKKLEENFIHFMGSIHALEHAIIGLLPLEVVADRNDFGGISISIHPQIGLGAVFVYDAIPGGAGLTKEAFQAGRRILESTKKAISSCACEDGCPGCIQSPKCGAGNRPLSKIGVLTLLDEILSPGSEGQELCDNLDIIAEAQPSINLPEVMITNTVENTLELPHYVVFDVETRRSAREVKGWNNARDMGVSIATLYDSREDKYFSYEQHQLDDMFARMSSCELVIGFNNLRFDNQVLLPFWEEWKDKKGDIYNLKSLDILKSVQSRTGVKISLDNFASSTLQTPKSADGLKALKWWKEGKLEEIIKYCQKDVEITRNLYLYGHEYGYLFYKNKADMLVRIDVDFRSL